MKEVLYFTASWCGPCQKIKPVFYELEETFKDISFSMIDVDLNSDLAQKHKVEAMPTFVFLHNRNEAMQRVVGASTDKLKKAVEAFDKL